MRYLGLRTVQRPPVGRQRRLWPLAPELGRLAGRIAEDAAQLDGRRLSVATGLSLRYCAL